MSESVPALSPALNSSYLKIYIYLYINAGCMHKNSVPMLLWFLIFWPFVNMLALIYWSFAFHVPLNLFISFAYFYGLFVFFISPICRNFLLWIVTLFHKHYKPVFSPVNHLCFGFYLRCNNVFYHFIGSIMWENPSFKIYCAPVYVGDWFQDTHIDQNPHIFKTSSWPCGIHLWERLTPHHMQVFNILLILYFLPVFGWKKICL